MLLCLYGMAATPLTSLAFMSLAALSEEHEVQVVMDGKGSLDVELHHHHAFTPGVRDHSGAVDRMLASLCKSGTSGDHVFDISAASPTMEPKVSRTDSTASSEADAPWSLMSRDRSLRVLPVNSWAMALARANFRTCNDAALPCIGTVVFLV